ncbi:MAG: Fic family protein, partial [Campylobacterales bacterium]|nr:Fic family protein [Campylobacterales bacterium]
KAFIEFMLHIAIAQIKTTKKHLNISTLHQNLLNYINYSRLDYTPQKALPIHTETITKELLLRGEIKRGEVQEIIHREQRTATQLIKDLMALGYITSDTPKGVIRLKFSISMAEFIFPSLLKEG